MSGSDLSHLIQSGRTEHYLRDQVGNELARFVGWLDRGGPVVARVVGVECPRQVDNGEGKLHCQLREAVKTNENRSVKMITGILRCAVACEPSGCRRHMLDITPIYRVVLAWY